MKRARWAIVGLAGLTLGACSRTDPIELTPLEPAGVRDQEGVVLRFAQPGERLTVRGGSSFDRGRQNLWFFDDGNVMVKSDALVPTPLVGETRYAQPSGAVVMTWLADRRAWKGIRRVKPREALIVVQRPWLGRLPVIKDGVVEGFVLDKSVAKTPPSIDDMFARALELLQEGKDDDARWFADKVVALASDGDPQRISAARLHAALTIERGDAAGWTQWRKVKPPPLPRVPAVKVPAAGDEAFVVASELSLRAAPTRTAKRRALLPMRQPVKVLEVREDWARVSTSVVEGTWREVVDLGGLGHDENDVPWPPPVPQAPCRWVEDGMPTEGPEGETVRKLLRWIVSDAPLTEGQRQTLRTVRERAPVTLREPGTVGSPPTSSFYKTWLVALAAQKLRGEPRRVSAGLAQCLRSEELRPSSPLALLLPLVASPVPATPLPAPVADAGQVAGAPDAVVRNVDGAAATRRQPASSSSPPNAPRGDPARTEGWVSVAFIDAATPDAFRFAEAAVAATEAGDHERSLVWRERELALRPLPEVANAAMDDAFKAQRWRRYLRARAARDQLAEKVPQMEMALQRFDACRGDRRDPAVVAWTSLRPAIPPVYEPPVGDAPLPHYEPPLTRPPKDTLPASVCLLRAVDEPHCLQGPDDPDAFGELSGASEQAIEAAEAAYKEALERYEEVVHRIEESHRLRKVTKHRFIDGRFDVESVNRLRLQNPTAEPQRPGPWMVVFAGERFEEGECGEVHGTGYRMPKARVLPAPVLPPRSVVDVWFESDELSVGVAFVPSLFAGEVFVDQVLKADVIDGNPEENDALSSIMLEAFDPMDSCLVDACGC
jgi:hypothetical protein